MADEAKAKRDADHLWHVWINRRNFDRPDKAPHEHSLYEFKSMLQFLEYGHVVIQQAFEGNLPKTHKQCSFSPTVEIKQNVLKCACQGQDVTTCPMLLGIKQVFEEDTKHYDIPVEHLYRTMAKTCAWHTYKTSCGIEEGSFRIDTSEGYLLDESDRMFWSTVYEHMADSGDEPDQERSQDAARRVLAGRRRGRT